MNRILILIFALISTGVYAGDVSENHYETLGNKSEFNRNNFERGSKVFSQKDDGQLTAHDGKLQGEKQPWKNKRPPFESCDRTAGWNEKAFDISYQAKAADVGETITFDDHDFRMVKIPFREFGSGDIYALKFPSREYNGPAYLTFGAYLQVFHVSSDSSCAEFLISGYPARTYYSDEGQSMSITYSEYTESSLRYSIRYALSIKIGETVVYLGFSFNEPDKTFAVDVDDYDFTDNIDLSLMTPNPEIINYLDDVIDYIEIQLIQ